jgi:F-type H+-transporting ATPase subunit gamma
VSRTVERLRRLITSAEELSSVTRTMKGLAAVNVRQYEQAASVVDAYQAVVEQGLQIVLRDPGPSGALAGLDSTVDSAAVIVFGSNQGLCGPINRRVAARTRAHLAALGPPVRTIAAVGTRLAVELEVAGVPVDERLELPHSLEGIAPRSAQLLLAMDRWRGEQPNLAIWLSFPDYGGHRVAYRPRTQLLLPASGDWLRDVASRPWPTHVLPTYAAPRAGLVAALMRQRLLVALHRTMTQTMAAIAASRLAAMQVAERDIQERLELLKGEHHRLRQAQITEELLDIVSGFDVLRSSARGSGGR